MKAIIKNGKINNGIQSCFISEYGVGIVFHNIDLIDCTSESFCQVWQ